MILITSNEGHEYLPISVVLTSPHWASTGGSWAILQLILGKVAAISLQLFLVIVAAIFGQSCSIFLADLQLISYD